MKGGRRSYKRLQMKNRGRKRKRRRGERKTRLRLPQKRYDSDTTFLFEFTHGLRQKDETIRELHYFFLRMGRPLRWTSVQSDLECAHAVVDGGWTSSSHHIMSSMRRVSWRWPIRSWLRTLINQRVERERHPSSFLKLRINVVVYLCRRYVQIPIFAHVQSINLLWSAISGKKGSLF